MRKQHQIKTEIQRNRLKPRTAIYWNIVSPGHAIGIRRYIHGWAWCARNGSVHTFKDSNHLSYDEALAMITSFWKKESAVAASYTVKQAIRDYAKHQRLHKGLRAEISADRNCTRALRPYLSRELASISKSELTELHASWVRGGSNDKVRASKASANRLLASCKACFNVALKADKVTVNFWSTVEAFKKVDGARSLFLTKRQVQGLLSATDGALHDLIRAGVLTGSRLGELVSAKVGDLDVDRGVLRVDGKTGPRDVVLSTSALETFIEIAGERHSDEALLLAPELGHWKSGQHSRPFAQAVKMAGLPADCVFYSLRHYAASMLIKSGINLLDVSANLGTGVDMLSKTYYKFLPSGMKSQLDAVAL